jgi:hypothetical protein
MMLAPRLRFSTTREADASSDSKATKPTKATKQSPTERGQQMELLGQIVAEMFHNPSTDVRQHMDAAQGWVPLGAVMDKPSVKKGSFTVADIIGAINKESTVELGSASEQGDGKTMLERLRVRSVEMVRANEVANAQAQNDDKKRMLDKVEANMALEGHVAEGTEEVERMMLEKAEGGEEVNSALKEVAEIAQAREKARGQEVEDSTKKAKQPKKTKKAKARKTDAPTPSAEVSAATSVIKAAREHNAQSTRSKKDPASFECTTVETVTSALLIRERAQALLVTKPTVLGMQC